MQIRPPDTTDVCTDVSRATVPASRSPTRGPPVTTAMWSDAIRPRIRSGASCCMIVLRNTAETTSAAPATASRSSANQNRSPGTSPNTVIEAPHTITAPITATPWRCTRPTQPLPTAAISAPTAGAA
jgi:hypothetical protein